jgi:predicted RNA-binding Zn-ribbon protein involved in translation (DUF1610 family)
LGKGGLFQKFIDGYKRFLYGRYGHDGLNRFISVFALALCVVSFFARSMYLYVFILITLGITFFRSMSKNFAARRRENQAFEKAAKPVKRYFKYWFIRIKSSKTHIVFTCDKCGSILRVPISAAGKKIEVKCPKCGDTSIKRIASGGKNEIGKGK